MTNPSSVGLRTCTPTLALTVLATIDDRTVAIPAASIEIIKVLSSAKRTGGVRKEIAGDEKIERAESSAKKLARGRDGASHSN